MNTDLIIIRHFIKRHPLQAARLLEGLTDEEATGLIRDLPLDLAIPLIRSMSVYKTARCLELMEPRQAAALLEKTDVGTAVAILRQADEQFRGEWLNRLSPRLADALRQKLEYPLYSVGAHMLPLTFALRKDTKVGEALKILKNNQEKLSLMVFVLDEEGRLAGGVHLHRLLFADEADQIAAHMIVDIPKFFIEMSLESVRDHTGWYEYPFLPVIDSSDKLIGILHYKAALKTKIKPGEDLTKHVIETSTALGELYRIGLTGFLQSISEVK